MRHLLLILASGVVTSTVANAQAPVLNTQNGHYYQVVPSASAGTLSWTAANSAAQAQSYNSVNGHLVTISTAEEQMFIISLLTPYRRGGTAPTDTFWIGGIRSPGNPNPAVGWRWVTNEPFSYTNWAVGEPNNAQGGIESVVEMYNFVVPTQSGITYPIGSWNDQVSNRPNPQGFPFGSGYIVEFDTSSTTDVRFDADRDGTVTFDDSSDDTSPGQPFRFWLNNDRDGFEPIEGVIADLNPSQGRLNARDTHITSLRDLEDFAKLAIRVPATFDPAESTVEISFSASTGTPVLNIYRAVVPDDTYLTHVGVAQAQLLVGLSESAVAVGGTPVPLPSALFSDGIAHLLFEGAFEGCGELSVRVLKSGSEISSGAAHLCLHDITAFYDHWTAGDDNSLAVRPLRKIPSGSADVVEAASDDYVVFVHGWRMEPWERRAFAETAYKRLWHSGYRGGFGLFSWATGWIPRPTLREYRFRYVRENYDLSEQAAWLSAAQLRLFLGQLWDQHPGNVRVLAHSMGNVVTSEALRLEFYSQVPRNLVHTYIATQAAVPADAYNRNWRFSTDWFSEYPSTGFPYFNEIAFPASRVVNFYNVFDYALLGWNINNQSKPDDWLGYRKNVFLGQCIRRGVPLRFPSNRYEIFAFCETASSFALGQRGGVGGVISRSVNLTQEFGFGISATDHSAQFMGEIQVRRSYWTRLLEEMGILHN